MNVLIPMIYGEKLKSDIEKSIIDQSIPCNIHLCYWLGTKTRQRNYTESRLVNEPIARYICQQIALAYNEKYCVIQDCDILHLKKTNFEDAVKVLEESTSKFCGAITLSGEMSHHISIGCIVYRTEILSSIIFQRSSINSCMCDDVVESLKQSCVSINRIDNKRRIMEI